MMQLGATQIAADLAPRRARWMRRAAFCVIATFILLTPMLPHAFDVRSPLLRSWRMYADVGAGILKGSFKLEQPAGAVREIAPLEMLGLERYPRVRHHHFQQRVETAEDVAALAGEFCRNLEPGARLSFEGAVGTRKGWHPLSVPDLCGGTHARRD